MRKVPPNSEGHPYEDQDPASLLGLLRQRYIQMNDYNRNLLSLLRSFEAEGKIQIIQHQANVFGLNPFNPTSLLAWVPLRKPRNL